MNQNQSFLLKQRETVLERTSKLRKISIMSNELLLFSYFFVCGHFSLISFVHKLTTMLYEINLFSKVLGVKTYVLN